MRIRLEPRGGSEIIQHPTTPAVTAAAPPAGEEVDNYTSSVAPIAMYMV